MAGHTSLACKTKSKGPKTLPWGIPDARDDGLAADVLPRLARSSHARPDAVNIHYTDVLLHRNKYIYHFRHA